MDQTSGYSCQPLQRGGLENAKPRTLVLAQVTVNGYSSVLEPGAKPEYTDLKELIKLLGSPKHVRARFDPIIPGFTTMGHFKRHLKKITSCGINHTTVNFMVPSYKKVGETLNQKGIEWYEATDERKAEILTGMLELATEYGVNIAACAESAGLAKTVPGILPARCADPTWPMNLGVPLSFKKHPSRKNCGCVYSDDWGQYFSRGGYKCPVQCLYCYAK
ncbi:MAG: DUF1848 domain-containing protein [Peptococcaceae bacterium]|nr:DUF1848 domain-containing protein [Peptococcaceae bacterium]